MTALALSETPATTAYGQYWWALPDTAPNTKIPFMGPVVQAQGGVLNVCIRFEYKSPARIDQAEIQTILQTLTAIHANWLQNLGGYDGFKYASADLKLFGIATTPVVTLDLTDKTIPVFVNADASCPATCSRFSQKLADQLDLSHGLCANLV